jgi:hypothetical protein
VCTDTYRWRAEDPPERKKKRGCTMKKKNTEGVREEDPPEKLFKQGVECTEVHSKKHLKKKRKVE